jgi:hypothetical protein
MLKDWFTIKVMDPSYWSMRILITLSLKYVMHLQVSGLDICVEINEIKGSLSFENRLKTQIARGSITESINDGCSAALYFYRS